MTVPVKGGELLMTAQHPIVQAINAAFGVSHDLIDELERVTKQRDELLMTLKALRINADRVCGLFDFSSGAAALLDCMASLADADEAIRRAEAAQ